MIFLYFCNFYLLYDEEETVYILYLNSDFDVSGKYCFMSAKGVGG